MLSILSMVVGFISSLAPDLMKRWQDASDKKHELAMTQMQIEATVKGYGYKADEVGVESYKDMVVAAHVEQAEALKTAAQWVANLSASVRPVLTYAFFGLYCFVKIAQFWLLMHPVSPWQDGQNVAEAFVAMWGEEDMALFSGIFAYWFGDRALAKRRAG